MASNSIPIPERLVEQARTELFEIPTERFENIQTLRRAILYNPRMKFQTDDEFLLRFLRARKFDQERTFQLIKNYYKHRLKYRKFFKNFSAAKMSQQMATNSVGCLPLKDDFGRAVIFFKISNWDTEIMSLEDLAALILLTLEIMVEDQESQITGIVGIIDLQDLSLSHITATYPSSLKLIFSLTYSCFPIRFKQVHFINVSKIFDILYVIMKPFLSQKLLDRFVFHDDLQSFHKCVNPEILYEEWGGSFGPYSTDDWNGRLLAHDVVLKENLKYYYEKK